LKGGNVAPENQAKAAELEKKIKQGFFYFNILKFFRPIEEESS
jgi:hypothetical protein